MTEINSAEQIFKVKDAQFKRRLRKGIKYWELLDTAFEPEILLETINHAIESGAISLQYRKRELRMDNRCIKDQFEAIYDSQTASRIESDGNYWQLTGYPGIAKEFVDRLLVCDVVRRPGGKWELIDPALPVDALVEILEAVPETMERIIYRGRLLPVEALVSTHKAFVKSQKFALQDMEFDRMKIGPRNAGKAGCVFARLTKQLGPVYRSTWQHLLEVDINLLTDLALGEAFDKSFCGEIRRITTKASEEIISEYRLATAYFRYQRPR